ncbi:MAG TPA: hemerythrin domain-containing protein [Actinomycetales bacterium]|nr:hemerythrin domain-containing protein [Actinomycetales bacterium]
MPESTLSAALEREHHEIDAGIEAFMASLEVGDASAEPLVRAMSALRRHIYLEEEFVFPVLRAAGMVPPVFVMLREHGEIWTAMDSIEAEVAGGLGGDAVIATCRALLTQLEAHNSKEEPIIYPQADALLDAEAQRKLFAFLDSGEMPPGWVAERARG